MTSQLSTVPIDMKHVLKYELTPMPLSMFHINGNPRIIKNKADLMNNLKVMVLTRGNKADVTILDGCAILWKIKWPSANGTICDFVKGFQNYVIQILKKTMIPYLYLIGIMISA